MTTLEKIMDKFKTLTRFDSKKKMNTYSTPLSVLPWWRFFFSNLTLKGVNLQNFGGVFFSPNLTLKGVNLQKFGGVIFFKFDT